MRINPRVKDNAAKTTLLLGRIFFGIVFFQDAAEHFSPEFMQKAVEKGVLLPHLLVPFSGIVALIGGLLIVFGFKAKFGAGLIVKVLIPVTIVMHDFWNYSTPHYIELVFEQFVKNLGLLGAAMMMIYFGPGPWSVDAWLKRRKARKLAEEEYGESEEEISQRKRAGLKIPGPRLLQFKFKKEH